MSKKMTHKLRMGIYMRAAMLQTMDLLGWTELEYCEYVFENGIMWLNATLNECDARMVSRSAIFWGWWKVEWYARESAWLMDVERKRIEGLNNMLKVLGAPSEVDVTEKSLNACFGNYGTAKRPVTIYTEMLPSEVLKEYKRVHNPHVLAERITEAGEALDASYCNTLIPILNAR